MILALLIACAHHAPEPCRESAVLPEVDRLYTCPAASTVAVSTTEQGPVVLCLCPASDEAIVRLEVTQ